MDSCGAHRTQLVAGRGRRGPGRGGIRRLLLWAVGPGNAPREGIFEVQQPLGAQGWRTVNGEGTWYQRTLRSQSGLQGRLLGLGPTFLAGLSPSPFLVSSSNVRLLILQDSISQASLTS